MAGLARILGLLLAGCYWLFVTGRLGEEPGLLACFDARGPGRTLTLGLPGHTNPLPDIPGIL